MKIKQLENNFKKISESVSNRSIAQEGLTDKTSLLWESIFGSRINFPSIDEFMVFRRNGATYGVGDPIYIDQELLVEHCRKNAILLKMDGITEDFLSKVSESTIGSPRLSSDHILGFEASPNFLKNLRNAFRIYNFCKEKFSDKEISICEIGAGYGMLSSMLHQLFNIKTYTYIDLPQNLYLTSLYLTTIHPEKKYQFLKFEKNSKIDLLDLNFVFASDVEKFTGEFDLIINIDSFGEMPLETASEYLNWVRDNLSLNGFLYSDNRVRVRENCGPMNFSDFGYLSGFEIISIEGTRYQAEILNQSHHLLFLQKKPNQNYQSKHWDLASILYTFGLANSIQSDVLKNWSETSPEIINEAFAILSANSIEDVNNFIRKMENVSHRPNYINFLIFMVKFAKGWPVQKISELDEYLSSNMIEPADSIAKIIKILDLKLSSVSPIILSGFIEEFKSKYPHLEKDLCKALTHPMLNIRKLRSYAAETIMAKKLHSSFVSRLKRRIIGSYFSY